MVRFDGIWAEVSRTDGVVTGHASLNGVGVALFWVGAAKIVRVAFVLVVNHLHEGVYQHLGGVIAEVGR